MQVTQEPSIDWAEWRPVIVVSLLVLLFSSLPYLAGYWLAEPPYHFVGFIFNLDDYQTYVAKMWLGYRGDWLYFSLFTAQEHPQAFVYPFYILLGHVARWLGLSLSFTFQLARLGTGIGLLLMVYRFAAAFLPRPARWYAFLLVSLASGLGWLTFVWPMPWLAGKGSVDMWVPEGYVFFSLYLFPHFSVAFICILAFFLNVLPLIEEEKTEGRPRHFLMAVVSGVILGFIHPYMILPLGLIPALYLGWRTWQARQWRWRPWLTLISIGLLLLPVTVYNLAIFIFIPHYRLWLAQGVMLSPPFINYLFGYGFLWPLAVWGAWRLRGHPRLPFLLIWVGVTFLLAYLPHNTQRRFVEGVHVALGLLAGVGLKDGFFPWVKSHAYPLLQRFPSLALSGRWLFAVLVILFLSLSNLLLILSHILVVTAQDSFLYYHDDDKAAMAWLLEQNDWDSPVLSDGLVGNLLGGHIGQRVLLGHWAETIDYQRTWEQVNQFFGDEMNDEQRAAWLQQWGLVYLYYGRYERRLGPFDPAAAPYLEPIFTQGEVTLYRFVP